MRDELVAVRTWKTVLCAGERRKLYRPSAPVTPVATRANAVPAVRAHSATGVAGSGTVGAFAVKSRPEIVAD
jgi:hypothetical protein